MTVTFHGRFRAYMNICQTDCNPHTCYFLMSLNCNNFIFPLFLLCYSRWLCTDKRNIMIIKPWKLHIFHNIHILHAVWGHAISE